MYSREISYAMQDGLSFYFAFIILLISIPICIYSLGYIEEYKKKYSTKYFWIMMLCFIFSMIGVVFARDSIVFMIFWELMSIFSFFLVIYEYNKKKNIEAGILYFIMTHISGLLLMVMFSFLYQYTGSVDFDIMMKTADMRTNLQKEIIFIFALLGFGAKAGLMPLHPWLPKAHPSAPSNISALMSGLMLKVALYGFIRINFMFFDGFSANYGLALLVIGTISAVFSIFNAIFKNDIKRLLAYSSAENIGIIFAILGLSMILNAQGHTTLAMLSFVAALFHILNHAVFKSLLFTSAGAVLYATGTKNMNELGGLYKKMKFAGICAFVGTAAISAIPPLNGFASEVLIFKSFIEGIVEMKTPGIAFVVILCGVLITFTSAGAVFTAVKSFGISYLGEPRSEKAVKTHSLPLSMNGGVGILALYCILLGVFSPIVLREIAKIASTVLKINKQITFLDMNNELMWISGMLFLVILLLYLFSRGIDREENVEISETWACGFNRGKSFMQYTGSGFTQPVSRFTGGTASYKKEINVKETIFLRQRTTDIIEEKIYSKIVKFIDYCASKVVKIQYGKVQLYISYIFLSLIIGILFVIKFV